MIHYSVQPWDRIFAESHGFLSFAKSMAKYIDKNISKNLRGKCIQKLLHHIKQNAEDAFKTASKEAI